jgi:hypothetical protein
MLRAAEDGLILIGEDVADIPLPLDMFELGASVFVEAMLPPLVVAIAGDEAEVAMLLGGDPEPIVEPKIDDTAVFVPLVEDPAAVLADTVDMP